MLELTKKRDLEVAHGDADSLLREIALDTVIYTAEQRVELVRLYDLVGKWYA